MAIQKGDKAPLFSLRASDKSVVSLSDFKGEKVVVLFFPLAFSDPCTDELCHFRDHLKIYEDLNARVLAISVDSPLVLDKFKEVNDFNFTLLSDFNKEACRAYGAMYEDFILDMRGVAKRSAFVIDGEGTVRYAEVMEEAPQMPDFEEIQKTLASIDG